MFETTVASALSFSYQSGNRQNDQVCNAIRTPLRERKVEDLKACMGQRIKVILAEAKLGRYDGANEIHGILMQCEKVKGEEGCIVLSEVSYHFGLAIHHFTRQRVEVELDNIDFFEVVSR
jgi:hypothetical protein